MTHTQVYKRDVNPRFGLLFNGRERERERQTQGVKRRQRRRTTPDSEREFSVLKSQVSN